MMILKLVMITSLKKWNGGGFNWSDDLGEELHKLYDYRANVIWREKVSSASATDNKTNKTSTEGKLDQKESEVGEESLKSKLIYCMEYNRGNCPNAKSHVDKMER